MPVLGLVLALEQGSESRVCEQLAEDPRVELGERSGARLPVVLEVEDPRDVDVWLARARELCLHVDVAFASLDDVSSSEEKEGRR